MPAIIRSRIGLIVITGDAKQEVREVRAGFRTGEQERSVERSVWIHVDLFDAGLNTGLDGVAAEHSGKVVASRERIVCLCEVGDWSSENKGMEADVLNPFDLGREHRDTSRSRPGHKTLRRQAGPYPARRPPHVIGASHVAEP